ncbi:unnamed protein product [Didymodactylos carnosus]|uniref:DUF5648 domain-containing protein n=1 Tax=Didymodactylos carnosus TaxID=1234261 RepID=A0A8S2FGL3_9BILA|nr:unnamed protein product [Didymodactylos carnosus]CAF4254601.1 unnamed protein product [Didymodactylos carnosus]
MLRCNLTKLLLLLIVLIVPTLEGGTVPFYRYSNSNDHFYTTNADEIGTTTPGALGRFGYRYEAVACEIFPSALSAVNIVPLYRYVSTSSPRHFYSINWQEIGTHTPGVATNGYRSEGIAGYVYPTKQPGTCPLYRYIKNREQRHFYTVNPCEIGSITPGVVGQHGYRFEQIAAYVVTSYPCNQHIACK